MRKFKLDKSSHRMKISQYLREVQNFSGRSLRNIQVFLNGKQVKTSKKLPSSGELKVIEKKKSTDIQPIDMNIKVAYEDNDLLIVNKDPFIVTHPTLKKIDYTLANGIVHYLYEKTGELIVPRFYNRLDMNTSGLIVIAKNSFSQSFLQHSGSVQKKYLAIAHGIVQEDKIIIEEPIYKNGDNLARIIDERGQYAKTIVKTVQRCEEKNITLVECELITGRTHQIRVHLNHIGHPIIGDDLYGNNVNKREGINRQLLHAYFISFAHPQTKENVDVKIEMADDMKDFLSYLSNDSVL